MFYYQEEVIGYQNLVITITWRALDDFFRTARTVPVDKLEWQPLECGRSVLSQMQEVAQVPIFFIPILNARAMPPFDKKEYVKALKARKQWQTLDECEQVCRENTEKLFAVIRDFPDDDLHLPVFLPFNGGMTRTMADVMMLHYNNTIYHTGQINYIQTLYGDTEMH